MKRLIFLSVQGTRPAALGQKHLLTVGHHCTTYAQINEMRHFIWDIITVLLTCLSCLFATPPLNLQCIVNMHILHIFYFMNKMSRIIQHLKYFVLYILFYKCPGCFRKQWARFQIPTGHRETKQAVL